MHFGALPEPADVANAGGAEAEEGVEGLRRLKRVGAVRSASAEGLFARKAEKGKKPRAACFHTGFSRVRKAVWAVQGDCRSVLKEA